VHVGLFCGVVWVAKESARLPSTEMLNVKYMEACCKGRSYVSAARGNTYEVAVEVSVRDPERV